MKEDRFSFKGVARGLKKGKMRALGGELRKDLEVTFFD